MNRSTGESHEGLTPQQRRNLIWTVMGVIAVYPMIGIWISRASATPWGVPETSPGGLYEIRMFSVDPFFPQLGFTPPGSGSDKVEGYIRLYDRRTGKLLESTYRKRLAGDDMSWSEDRVISLGREEIIWKLPEREEHQSTKH